jgi:hypothetical protein
MLTRLIQVVCVLGKRLDVWRTRRVRNFRQEWKLRRDAYLKAHIDGNGVFRGVPRNTA